MSDSPRARLLAAQRALAIEPGEWRHRLETVAALRLLGRDAEAVEQWQQCQEQDPRDMRARAYLASLQMPDAGESEET